MFGRMKTRDIPAFTSHADAAMYWGGIKPIRGRGEDIRPIGMRRKDHMRIAMSEATGDVHCILYDTKVVTFHPNNTVTVRVPEAWRTNSTAQFIEAVLGSHRVNVGVKDNDVVMFLNPHMFRMGPETRFKFIPDGLLLLGGNIVKSTHAVNRKVMNAARKEIKGFTTYLRGANKLRDGVYSVDEKATVYEFLRKHNQVASNISAERFATSNSYWSLSSVHAINSTHNKESFTRWLDRVKFVLQTMRTGTHDEWYALTLWLAASNCWLTQMARVDVRRMENDITCMLLAVTPDALIETPEPFGEIKVDTNAGVAEIRRTVIAIERGDEQS